MQEKINFTEIEKIHPAFAGLLVDWSIGSREITATLVNLIIEDNISVIGDKVILNNLNTKYAFEKEFLKIIFENKKELSFQDLSSKAYNINYRDLLNLISKALITEGYIQENVTDILNKNIRDKSKLSAFSKFASSLEKSKSFSIKNVNHNIDYSNLNKINFKNFRINFGLVKLLNKLSLIIFIVFFISLFVPIISIISLLFFPLFPVLFITFVLTKILLKLKKLFDLNLESVLTDKGKASRKLAIELYNYIKKYPHLEDRLANELVSYSIGFGVGKNWINRLSVGNVQINKFIEKYNDSTDITLNFFDFNKFLMDFKDNKN